MKLVVLDTGVFVATLIKPTKKQADDIGLPEEGPYKPEHCQF